MASIKRVSKSNVAFFGVHTGNYSLLWSADTVNYSLHVHCQKTLELMKRQQVSHDCCFFLLLLFSNISFGELTKLENIAIKWVESR